MEQTADTVQASSKDMAQKTFSAAESNLRSSLDDAKRSVPAKDLHEAAQIQSEFVRTQAEAIQTRMREFGSAIKSTMGQPPWGAAKQTGAAAGQDTSGTTRARGGKSSSSAPSTPLTRTEEPDLSF
jgi:polyhydroxyalkanoate synthesis regulator protein